MYAILNNNREEQVETVHEFAELLIEKTAIMFKDSINELIEEDKDFTERIVFELFIMTKNSTSVNHNQKLEILSVINEIINLKSTKR